MMVAASGSGSRWDVAMWDGDDTWASDSIDLHRAVGFDRVSRWAKIRMVHEQRSEGFGIGNLLLTGQYDANQPEVL
jgi:hypothetical protein